jgi:uncharacterized membrane protein YkoI
MKSGIIFARGLATLLLAGSAIGCSTQAALRNQSRISEADARRIALARVPNGTIKESELEKEHGALVWSFDITTPGTGDITEVLVDAVNGTIVAVETEPPPQPALR